MTLHTRFGAVLALLFLVALLSAPMPAYAACPGCRASTPHGTSIVAQTAPTPPPVDWPGLVAWLKTDGAVMFFTALLLSIPFVQKNVTPGGQTAIMFAVAGIFGILSFAFGGLNTEQVSVGQKLWDILRLIVEFIAGTSLIRTGARGVKVATLALLGGRSHALALMQTEDAKRVKAAG